MKSLKIASLAVLASFIGAGSSEVIHHSTSSSELLLILTIIVSATSLTFIAVLLMCGIPRSTK